MQRLAVAALMGLAATGAVSALPAAQVAATAPDWQAQPVRLLMVERRGCIYCENWHDEIGGGYDRSAEGRAAPLLTVDLDGAWPDGLALDSRPFVTPTFILLRDGSELARITGYPGEHHFYPLVAEMLAAQAIPAPAAPAAPQRRQGQP